MCLLIRKAPIELANILTQIQTVAYNDETNRFGPGRDGGPPGYNDVNQMKMLINQNNYYQIIVDQIIIGCFWLEHVSETIIKLQDFCIHPNYQNKGYGFKALKEIENLHPLKVLWRLETPYYSVRNQHLYEKVGYKKVGVSEDGFLFKYEKKCK